MVTTVIRIYCIRPFVPLRPELQANLVSSINSILFPSYFCGIKSIWKNSLNSHFDFSRLIRTHTIRVRVSRRRSERGGRRRSRGRVRLSALVGVLMGSAKADQRVSHTGFQCFCRDSFETGIVLTIKAITCLIAPEITS